VLDGSVLPDHPQAALAAGAARDVALLVGANREEMRLFQRIGGDAFRPADEAALLNEIGRAGIDRPAELLDDYRRRLSGPDGIPDLADLRAAFLTDSVYREPATRMAAAQAAAGGRAYSYLFAEAPFGPGLGAFHGCEGIYLFEDLAENGITSDRSREVRDDLQTAWATFAATGEPGWPTYDANTRGVTRQFGGHD
jgi:para-nitrobenzyl esterase